MNLRTAALIFVALAIGLGVYFLSRRGADSPAADTPAVTLARERAAAHFADEATRSLTRADLAPLVKDSDAALEDLVRAAAVEFADNQPQAARAFLDRAAKLDARSPAVNFLRGQMLKEEGKYPEASVALQMAFALAPDDLPTCLALAEVKNELGAVKETEALYRKVLSVGIENGQMWYVVATYRLARLYIENGREADAEPLNLVWRDLQKRGIEQPRSQVLLLGSFGKVPPPVPMGSRVEALPSALTFTDGGAFLPELGGDGPILAHDLDGDLRADLLAYGRSGVILAFHRDAAWKSVALTNEPADIVVAFDADNDGDLDLLVVSGTSVALWMQKEEAFTQATTPFPKLPSAPRAAVAVDFDHEGDLDLCLVGDFGVRVWRRDGTSAIEDGGTYTDATADAGLPADKSFTWVVTEDFDGDNDVDFLFGGPSGMLLADSLRAGKFQTIATRFEAPREATTRPLVADFDGDGVADVWSHGPSSRFAAAGKVARNAPGVVLRAQAECLADFDGDGAIDVLGADATSGSLIGVLALGIAPGTQSGERVFAPQSPVRFGGALSSADFDDDGGIDLVARERDGVHVWRNAGPFHTGVRLSYRGVRDNRRALGAVVEYRAGTIYRRIYWRGEPNHATVGTSKKIDVLRITWPNGSVTTKLDLGLVPQAGVDDFEAALGSMSQPSGQIGSCPFLYTWNGTRFEFVSDVLGITPLGLPIAPGMLVPPDHDEYVLVTGEQLAARDGRYEMQFTEELREVTYLDHAKLLVIDHPEGTEIYPNERFTFPPFPVAHTHTVRGSLAPTKAVGSDGRDYTAACALQDDVFPQPMQAHPAQFAGLCAPWFVELSFDEDAVASAKLLRLVMTGWFFWSDASANMASARNPQTPFIPPILQVPDGKGGWTDAGPPVGFPAGKTKTMVIDVTGILRRDDPRIRVFTSLRLYWDVLRLAVDDDDAPLRTTTISVASAKLWRRGFSAPLGQVAPGEADPANKPERFDWQNIASEPRWNQHPGLYTRYGDCQELLDVVDDRFAILGAGDALTLSFDARGVPTLEPGQRRDYLVYLDGWAKDRDPNTIQALEVEPLPFHAMSGYPYRLDEHFPSGEVHTRWRAKWNTRPAFRWLRPVAPAAETSWMLGD